MVCKSIGLDSVRCGDRVGILGCLEYDVVEVSITSTRTIWMNLGDSRKVENMLHFPSLLPLKRIRLLKLHVPVKSTYRCMHAECKFNIEIHLKIFTT
jgi:hypothetical protein